MALVIKKRVSLEFLGEDYKDSYVLCSSVSIGEYEKIKDDTVKDLVIKHFLEGKIKQDSGLVDITKDNLEELPGEVFVEVFAAITGQLDPKSQGLSTMQSSMEQKPQEN
jgi:hypothetical protein